MALLPIVIATCKYHTLYFSLPVVSFFPPTILVTVVACCYTAADSTIPTVVSHNATPSPVVSPPMLVTYQLHVPLTPLSSLVQPEMMILFLFCILCLYANTKRVTFSWICMKFFCVTYVTKYILTFSAVSSSHRLNHWLNILKNLLVLPWILWMTVNSLLKLS